MNDRTFAPVIGVFSSLISFEIWQNLMLSFVVAFVGGIAAWIARKLCDYVNKKINSKTKPGHETN